MDAEQKATVKNSIGRLAFAGISVLLQVGWILFAAIVLSEYFAWVSALTRVAAVLLALRIYGMHTNAAMKIPWIILILTFPVLGVCLYLMTGKSDLTKKKRQQFEKIQSELSDKLVQDQEVARRLYEQDPAIGNQSRYLQNYGKYPVYQNTDIVFYGEATDALEAQKEAVRSAKHFIFMEYHAIEDAGSFGELKDLLARKVKEGVEVRIFYDDVGSIGFINIDFIDRMEKLGIRCRVFNPVHPVLNMFMNNRDHRKITVIDGETGFTGGYNLADEYFNLTHPYGYWKDTGVRIRGDAVRSLTLMFLEMWNYIKKTDDDYDRYLAGTTYQAAESGYIQPYGDTPLDEEHVGENVYLNIIKNAKRYIYFMTPYLIITDEMNRELGLAAKRGVDVRIVTPGIPDKKLVYRITRSYYAGLVRRGVRIYEYTPGFCHGKQCVCDDEVATVGTINLDYRSLYFHFEDGILFYDCHAVKEVKEDFEQVLPVCREVTEQYRTGRSAMLRIGQCILRLFAPLL